MTAAVDDYLGTRFGFIGHYLGALFCLYSDYQARQRASQKPPSSERLPIWQTILPMFTSVCILDVMFTTYATDPKWGIIKDAQNDSGNGRISISANVS